MITINQDSSNSSPVDNQFIDRVLNILTLYNSLPYKIPRLMVIECIKTAARYFYMYYGNSWRKAYLYLRREDIDNYFKEEFPNSHQRLAGVYNGETQVNIRVNERIRIISALHKFDGNNNNIFANDLQDDFSGEFGMLNGFRGSNRGHFSSIDRNLFLIENTVKLVEMSSIPSIFGKSIPFEYNQPTNTLMIKTNVNHNLLIECFVDVDINALYNDSLFERYVIALSKRELRRLIGSHTIQLPGDVTINVDELTAGVDDIERVEEIIKNSSGIGDIMLFR